MCSNLTYTAMCKSKAIIIKEFKSEQDRKNTEIVPYEDLGSLIAFISFDGKLRGAFIRNLRLQGRGL